MSVRVLHPELLDEGRESDEEVGRSLRDLRRINDLFGGKRLLLEALASEVERRGLRKFTVLDVASASCDVPLAIVERAGQRGWDVQVFALEYWRRHLAIFRDDWKHISRLHPVCADALRAPFTDRHFDFVTCSLFLHHLTEGQAANLLSNMSRWARCAVIVSDLERRPVPYYFFRLFSRFFTTSPVSRVDGEISFRQSFRKRELQRVAENAGIKNCTVERRWPFRLVLIASSGAGIPAA